MGLSVKFTIPLRALAQQYGSNVASAVERAINDCGSLRVSVLGCPVTGQEYPQAKVRIIAEAEGAPFH